MDLREQIADMIFRAVTFGKINEKKVIGGPEELADAILALIDSQPSQLEAVRECEHKWYSRAKGTENQMLISIHPTTCDCHGTGIITRTLTNKEALELLYSIIGNKDNYDWEERYFLLPSGERVRLREEK